MLESFEQLISEIARELIPLDRNKVFDKIKMEEISKKFYASKDRWTHVINTLSEGEFVNDLTLLGGASSYV